MEMQERAFGIEVEYSVACQDKDSSFCTEFSYNTHSSLYPAEFLLNAVHLLDSAPEKLKSLNWYPKTKTSHYWLGSNGARLYFDNSAKFPEYATPECASPKEVLIHSLAGDGIMEDLRQEVLRQNMLKKQYDGRFKDIFVFKMNTHFAQTKETIQATGCHENYLTLQEFEKLKNGNNSGLGTDEFCDFLVPFLMSRQILDGAGGIYWSQTDGWQYIISQRAFFIDTKTGTLTVGNFGRGFIHFRSSKPDQSPAGKVRLHLHCGDITMSPIGKYIAVGATHLVLRAFEEGDRSRWKHRLSPESLVYDFQKVSADPALTAKIRLTGDWGLKERQFSAIELQKKYIDYVTSSIKNFSEDERVSLKAWTAMVEKLDKNPMEASRELDWLIKLRYLKENLGGNFASPKARFASALYHDNSARGLYNKLLQNGRVDIFANQEEVTAARMKAPRTRAEFRSRHIKTILNLDESFMTFTDWGTFFGIDGPILIPHPMDKTIEEGETALKKLEKLASRKK